MLKRIDAVHIEYTDATGNTVVLNPFDGAPYDAAANRISEQDAAAAQNMRNRKNYEDAVANLQISIDAGRTNSLDSSTKLPPVPEFIVFPDDPNLPKETGVWNPPLATLRAAQNVLPSSGSIAAVNQTHVSALQKLAAVFVEVKPTLDELLQILMRPPAQ